MKYNKFILFLLGMSMLSCVSVKEYQKSHLNDGDMKLKSRDVEVFEADFQTYREAAVGGTNGKSGSGCGCN